VYEGVVIEKRCAAGVLPVANLKKYDGSYQFTRILHKTPAMPNQAFSAGPRITHEEQARIAAALLSPQASEATAALRAAYGSEKGFAAARKEEYAGLDSYLKGVWGYSR
jgi:ABC-type phosphate/phosphonate transport system substrate-binding protein